MLEGVRAAPGRGRALPVVRCASHQFTAAATSAQLQQWPPVIPQLAGDSHRAEHRVCISHQPHKVHLSWVLLAMPLCI